MPRTAEKPSRRHRGQGPLNASWVNSWEQWKRAEVCALAKFPASCAAAAARSAQHLAQRPAYPYNILVVHGRKHRQGDQLAADSSRHRRVLRPVSLLAVVGKARNAGIMLADSDAAIGHHFLKFGARHALCRKI